MVSRLPQSPYGKTGKVAHAAGFRCFLASNREYDMLLNWGSRNRALQLVEHKKNEEIVVTQRIYRSHREPRRKGLSFDERRRAEDQGLITCWEVSREMRKMKSELAERAVNGELPPMG